MKPLFVMDNIIIIAYYFSLLSVTSYLVESSFPLNEQNTFIKKYKDDCIVYKQIEKEILTQYNKNHKLYLLEYILPLWKEQMRIHILLFLFFIRSVALKINSVTDNI